MSNPFSSIVSQASKPLESAEDRVRVARYLARCTIGYFAPPLMAMRMYESKSVPTMGVSPTFQMYYNPDFVNSCVEKARAVTTSAPCPVCKSTSHHDLAYIAGVLLHEAMHPFKRHAKRSRSVGADTQSLHTVWNVAADLEINDMLLSIFDSEFKYNKGKVPRLCLPEGVVLLSKYGFEPNKSAEFYFSELMKNHVQFENEPDCGSGADGYVRDYEKGDGAANPQESDPDNPPYGASEDDVRDMERKVARKIKEQQGSRGDVPNGMVVWADGVLAPPKHNWRTEIHKMVRYGESIGFGEGEPTFRRLSRLSAALDFDIILPSELEHEPRSVAVIDTSGSMLGGSTNRSLLELALAEVDAVRAMSGGEIYVVDCDAEAYTDMPKRVSRLSHASLRGGGGTDMRVGIRVAERMSRVDYTMLFTDGGTPFPEHPLKNGSSLIIILVGVKPEDVRNLGVPSFAHVVCIDEV